MDQQMASQLGADLFLLHAPSVYDFRERDDMLFAYPGDVNVTSVYEMHPSAFTYPNVMGVRRTLVQKDNDLIIDETQQVLGEMERAFIADNLAPRLAVAGMAADRP
jgi:hypothetical protein